MGGIADNTLGQAGPFLSRLARDKRGNTLALMGAFLIPIAALAGSGVDVARMYVVKARLQQACDAGVLAGRKFMDPNGGTQLDTNASTQATTFFNNNFPSNGWMQTSSIVFSPSKTADNQVAGTASVTMPMSVMKMFKMPDQTINVTCQARYDVADTDIMFVLDTTGSMADKPDGTGGGSSESYTRPDGTTGYRVQEANGSKISGLRSAVLNFYDTVATNADPTTHIRYGFVTYSSAVNAGAAIMSLSPSYMVSTASYQSRKVIGDANNGNTFDTTTNNVTRAQCDAMVGRSPASGFSSSGTAASTTERSWNANSSGNGNNNGNGNNSGTGNGNLGTCVTRTQPLKPLWRYAQWPFDVSQYLSGNAVTDPSKITGAQSTWQGCIEERDTTASSSFDPSNLPPDLDPDLVPTNDATRWRPMWPDVIYKRGSNMNYVDDSGDQSNPYGDASYYPNYGTATYRSSGYVSCGKPVKRLSTMTRAEVSAFVNASDFAPLGGTYHDTGMIWGTRMISPTGIFKDDTSTWPGRSSPNRYIVFMTDGQMAPNTSIYGMYGMEYYDKRVTNGSYSNDDDYHNARFVAECSAAKQRNITVFVVGFGQTLNSQLTSCASPGQAYYASDNAALDAAFQKIAKQVAMLRISQ